MNMQAKFYSVTKMSQKKTFLKNKQLLVFEFNFYIGFKLPN